MKKVLIIIALFLLALSARAMTPLTELDLSNVSNPLSLGFSPENSEKTSNNSMARGDFDDINQLSESPSGIRLHFNISLFEDTDGSAELYTSNKTFASFTMLWSNNDVFNRIPIFLVDPVTGKNYTALFESYNDILSKYKLFPGNQIYWKTYVTIISTETVSAEDLNEPNSAQYTGTPSITHSNTNINNSNDPYRYQIMSGNTGMRDTYINNTSTTIQSGSWVDVKTR